MNIEIVSSADGSHTLYLPEMNETYHSLHGAVTESQYVFIEKGLKEVAESEKNALHILEVGFGTGLNALLTLAFAEQHQRRVVYHTLEPYPLPAEVWQKLNYKDRLPEAVGHFYEILHQLEWEKELEVTPYFVIKKNVCRLENWQNAPDYDLIYFDAFAPGKQAEVWELSNIEKCYNLIKSSGLLVSYCAQGQFRRNLQSVGFDVERLPGPPGKKEMIRALKR